MSATVRMRAPARPGLDAPPWEPGPLRVELEPGTVDVWRILLDAYRYLEPCLLPLLGDRKRGRDGGAADAVTTRRQALAHGALRSILGRYLGLLARDVTVVRRRCSACGETHGDLDLAARHDSRIRFDLAHGGGVALASLAHDRATGVAVEWLDRRLDLDALLAWAGPRVSPASDLSDRRRLLEVYGWWVREQASRKALGLGLDALGLGSSASPPPPSRNATVELLDLDVADDHVAALAVADGYAAVVRCWDWYPETELYDA